MHLHSFVILIRDDLNVMKDFYLKVLGFEVVNDFGTCIALNNGLSLWKADPLHPISPYVAKKSGSAFELCLETSRDDEFDSMVSRILSAKPKLLHDVRVESWGQKTIRFFDSEDNLIEYGESIPCFVRRMSREGLSAEEIAAKTGVPLGEISKILSQQN